MRTPTIFLILLLSYFTSISQEVSFSPNWSVGEKKMVQVKKETRMVEGDSVTQDDVSTYDFLAEIKDATDKNFIIEFTLDNGELIESFKENILTKEMNIQPTIIRFSVDKESGKEELMNWEEIRDKIVGDIDTIVKNQDNWEEYSKEMMELTIAAAAVKVALLSESATKSVVMESVGFMFIPFGKKFVLGKGVEVNESTANPFSPKADTLVSVTTYTLESMDKASGMAKIKSSSDIDTEMFKKAMMEMMIGMVKAFGGTEEEIEEVMEELKDMEFNMNRSAEMTFNSKTSWPVEMVETTTTSSKIDDESFSGKSIRSIQIK